MNPKVVDESVDKEDEAQKVMEQAAALFAKAASDKANRSQVLKELESVLAKVKISDFPDLAESDVIQQFLSSMDTSSLKPGQTKNKGTLAEVSKAWTLQSIHDEVRAGRMKLKTLIPAEAVEIIWNGVHFYLPANEEVEIPDCFYQEYTRVMKSKRLAAHHQAYMNGSTEVPPDPSLMTPETSKVRAWSIGGRAFGVPTGVMTTGRIMVAKEEAE